MAGTDKNNKAQIDGRRQPTTTDLGHQLPHASGRHGTQHAIGKDLQ